MIESEINEIKGDIVNYSALVGSMFEKSITGFVEKQLHLFNEVIFVSEPRANEIELIIDDKCISMIAKYSPKASSLRVIQSMMKINLDLERMADHCVNISRAFIDINDDTPYVQILPQIVQMKTLSINLFNLSIKSFVESDISIARIACESDNQIDVLKSTIESELISSMENEPKNIRSFVNLISIIRNIERFSDLATNIAENSIFAINGKTIKHSYK